VRRRVVAPTQQAPLAYVGEAATCALPAPITDPNKIARLDRRRNDRLGGVLHEYQHAA
jgi:hypothetical protein